MFLWFVYGTVDKWVYMVKHQKAQHVMHRCLAGMQTAGYLTVADEAQLVADFASFSCTVNPFTGIMAPRESRGDSRVLRPDPVSLLIEAVPSPQPFQSEKLLGNTPPDGAKMIKVGGTMRSERVNP